MYFITLLNFDYFSFFSLACRCEQEAIKRGFTYFGIAFWAECYGGNDEEAVMKLIKGRENVDMCKSYGFKGCDDSDKNECVGKANYIYLYGVSKKDDSK